jgi:2-methylcitrate dehydratase
MHARVKKLGGGRYQRRPARAGDEGRDGLPLLTAKTWGFYDVLFKGNAFKFQRYGSL